MKKSNGYWCRNKDRCAAEARKYTTRTEFSQKSASAYKAARLKGWLSDICKRMVRGGNESKKIVYAFEFNDGALYIGLTNNIKRRIREHKSSRKSCVNQYIENHCPIYSVKELTQYIDVEQAVNLEKKLISNFRSEDNISLLNRSSGGSVGGYELFWTLDRCTSEAKKYQSRKDFEDNSPSAYNSCLNNGWGDLVCSHMQRQIKPKNTWSQEACHREALRFNYRSDFFIHSKVAYVQAKKLGCFELVTQHMKKRKRLKIWPYDRCFEQAQKFNKKSDFRLLAKPAYNAAVKGKYLSQITAHMN